MSGSTSNSRAVNRVPWEHCDTEVFAASAETLTIEVGWKVRFHWRFVDHDVLEVKQTETGQLFKKSVQAILRAFLYTPDVVEYQAYDNSGTGNHGCPASGLCDKSRYLVIPGGLHYEVETRNAGIYSRWGAGILEAADGTHLHLTSFLPRSLSDTQVEELKQKRSQDANRKKQKRRQQTKRQQSNQYIQY